MLQKSKHIDNGLLLSIPSGIPTIRTKKNLKKHFNGCENQKIIVKKRHLSDLIFQLHSENLLFESNGGYLRQFSKLYFDTPDLKFYFENHNQRANRFEVYRKFDYNTEKSNLIVKHTDNKHHSHKSRVKTNYFNDKIPLKYFDFINKNINFSAFQLHPILNCEFNRYTFFIGKSMDWMVSIDTELVFWNNQRISYLNDLAVVSIKAKNPNLKRMELKALKQHPVSYSGLNKYCIGMALTNPGLKQNLLKHKIQGLKRISNAN